MTYSFYIDSIHTKKLCIRLSSHEVQFYTENGHFAFLSPTPSLRGIRATYAVHHRLNTIQLLTLNNLGGTLKRICSPDIRSVSTLEVLRNRVLQIDIYLLTYLLESS